MTGTGKPPPPRDLSQDTYSSVSAPQYHVGNQNRMMGCCSPGGLLRLGGQECLRWGGLSNRSQPCRWGQRAYGWWNACYPLLYFSISWQSHLLFMPAASQIQIYCLQSKNLGSPLRQAWLLWVAPLEGHLSLLLSPKCLGPAFRGVRPVDSNICSSKFSLTRQECGHYCLQPELE